MNTSGDPGKGPPAVITKQPTQSKDKDALNTKEEELAASQAPAEQPSVLLTDNRTFSAFIILFHVFLSYL